MYIYIYITHEQTKPTSSFKSDTRYFNSIIYIFINIY